jgi:hypothetical protein
VGQRAGDSNNTGFARRATDQAQGNAYLDSKVSKLETDLHTVKKSISDIVESLPGKATDEHLEHHRIFTEDLAIRKEKEEDDKRIKKELKEKFIKTVIQGIGVALFAILALGLKAQFAEWVHKAIEEKAVEKSQSAAEPNKGAGK